MNYQYDALNRLSSAVAQDNSWGQSFTYDGFGNLTQQTVTAGSAPSMSLNIDPATNHVVGSLYDANGNQYNTPGGVRLNYDAENRLIADGTYAYFYDAANERIWKKGPQGEEFIFYGLRGERLATFTPQFTTIYGVPYMTVNQAELDGYFGGRLEYWHLANGSAGGDEQDRLGSVRFDSANGLSTFFPYGTEMGAGTANDRVKFGTYRRDASTGLDYAMNRYYLSNWGRFMSADPYGGSAHAADPQSWNKYAYSLDDPINKNDPSGMDPDDPGTWIFGPPNGNPFCWSSDGGEYVGAFLTCLGGLAGDGTGKSKEADVQIPTLPEDTPVGWKKRFEEIE